MPRDIQGVRYFAAVEVAQEVNVSRQTLWRWRREGRIAPGMRFRDGQILFTKAELDDIRKHANKLEPAGPQKKDRQLGLFSNGA